MSLINRRAALAAGAMLTTSASLGGRSMSAQTTTIFGIEDLEDTRRTSELAERDLNALRAVAD